MLNPWTSSWPRYELKVLPSESYMHLGKKYVYKWRVVLMKQEPDERPTFEEVGYARWEDDTKKIATSFARDLAIKEPRNPNDIRVLDQHGKCFFSVRGSC